RFQVTESYFARGLPRRSRVSPSPRAASNHESAWQARRVVASGVTVALPDEPEAFEREERVDALQSPSVRDDQVGQAARRYRRRLDAELPADRLHDPVYLPGEAVDEPGLQARRRVLGDHGRRLDEVDGEEPRRARRERLHRDLDPRRDDAPCVLAFRRDDVEVRRGAEV